MRNKLLLFILTVIIVLIPQKAYAQENSSISSTTIQIPQNYKAGSDYRVKILKDYLAQQNSPLTPYAPDFIYYADKYNLDWKLVAAISGVESTFGKEIPPYSYNGWGWGVYGNNVIRFNSCQDGIKTVSQGLRTNYMDKWGGTDIYSIGAMYASSKAWPDHVEYYVNKIQEFALSNPQYSLSLSF
jgi:hypothetical protein